MTREQIMDMIQPTDAVSLAVTCAVCGQETLVPASSISEGTIVTCHCGGTTILGESIAHSCRYVMDLQAAEPNEQQAFVAPS